MIAILILLGAWLGCGDDDGSGPTDAGARDTGTPEVDGGPPDTGRTDAGSMGDMNDSFATAEPIDVDAKTPTSGVIDPSGDDDYYSFAATAGQWIQIFTEANPDANPDRI